MESEQSSTYESQLNKWAAKKFNLNLEDIKSVDLEPEVEYGGYCETCQYEYAVMTVSVIGHNGKYIAETKYREYEFNFAEILKEIIEA